MKGALLPNHVSTHPRVEIISATEWSLIATLDPSVVEFIIRITHTGEGEGVLLSYKKEVTDREALGPYFGDNIAPTHNTLPTTEIKRRARPKHIYAKLDIEFYLPNQTLVPRPNGPTMIVEEWTSRERSGMTTQETDTKAAGTSDLPYFQEIADEQEKIAKEE